jgi:teichuronic acid biosynthesis glycosyltransferase TuaH
LDKVLGRSNVSWLGPRPFSEIEQYLAAADVGIVPYDPTDRFNIGSFPLKTLEYLAAGLPVVSTNLPATRWLASELITIANGPGDFSSAVEASARVRHDEKALRARRRFAEMHSWDRRIDDWIDILDRLQK